MGLFNDFGKGLSGLFGEGFADRAAIASALLEGDGAAVAQIKARQAQAQKDQQENAIKQAAMMHVYQAAKARGLSEDDAIVMATNPDKFADVIGAWSKPHDVGPEGGFRENPMTHQIASMPRYDSDGNYYAPNNDASQAPQRLIKGTKAIPIPDGGSVKIVDSVTGRPDNYGGPSPQVQGGNDLRAAAIDAIQRGADPTKVLERLKQMQGGQSGSPSTGGFSY
jgi:hypothetical protein